MFHDGHAGSSGISYSLIARPSVSNARFTENLFAMHFAGIGKHSKGQASLPVAVRGFLIENGYRFEELRPGVFNVRPKFRRQ
jgi:hypothetical protein